MKTFRHVILDLKEIGRDDAIEVLGKMYNDNFQRVKNYTDNETEFLSSWDWIDGVISWAHARGEYGMDFGQVHHQLKAMRGR